MKRRIFTIALSGLVLTAVGCESKPPENSASGNTALIQAQQQAKESLNRAKQWQPNATLQRVCRQFEGSLNSDPPQPLTFAYASLADPTHIFEVQYAPGGGHDRRVAQSQAEISFIPIEEGDWQVSPEKALETAEEAGGKAFRTQHLAGYKVLEQLQRISGHPAQWYFRYDTGDGSKLRHEFFINAKTSTVDLQKEGLLPSRS